MKKYIPFALLDIGCVKTQQNLDVLACDLRATTPYCLEDKDEYALVLVFTTNSSVKFITQGQQ